MQERTSEPGDYYPLGDELVHWIDGSDDFPLDKAHRVNNRRWAKGGGNRFVKFTDEADLTWAKTFFDNPSQRVEGPLLEVGCAGGHNLRYCAQQGVQPLFGIDISEAFVQKARARVPHASIQQADFLNLPYESASFNSIIARGSPHITTTKSLLAALREAYRVLRDGGLIYLHRRFRPSLLEQDKAKRISWMSGTSCPNGS